MARDERPGEYPKDLLQHDPYEARQKEKETTDEYRTRIDRMITGTNAEIDILKPSLAKSEKNMNMWRNGVENLTIERDGPSPRFDIKEKLAETARLAADAKHDFDTHAQRMREYNAKLTILIDAYDAIPDLDQASD